MKHSKSFRSIASLLFVLALFLSLAACAQTKTVKVEIAYRNHPPVRAVLEDVDKLLAKYDQQLKVSRFDVDTPDGEAFLKEKQIDGPTVLAIFIDDSLTYQQGADAVQFFSFPADKGTAMTAAGNWTLDQLDAALSSAVKSKE